MTPLKKEEGESGLRVSCAQLIGTMALTAAPVHRGGGRREEQSSEKDLGLYRQGRAPDVLGRMRTAMFCTQQMRRKGEIPRMSTQSF